MGERATVIEKYQRAAASNPGAYLKFRDFLTIAGLRARDLYHAGFSNYSELIKEAGGIEPTNQSLDCNQLLDDLARVARKLGGIPTRREYVVHGEYGDRTVENNLGNGSWKQAIIELRRYAEEIGDSELQAKLVLHSESAVSPVRREKATQKAIPMVGNPSGLPNLDRFTKSAQAGAIQMAEHYSRLYCLERQMREIVEASMTKAHGENWWVTCVHENTRQAAAKLRNEEDRRGVTPRSDRQIDYITLGDLWVIVDSHWNAFSGEFKNQQTMGQIMRTLNSLRACVAHCTPLAEDEIKRLDVAIGDWLRQLKS